MTAYMGYGEAISFHGTQNVAPVAGIESTPDENDSRLRDNVSLSRMGGVYLSLGLFLESSTYFNPSGELAQQLPPTALCVAGSLFALAGAGMNYLAVHDSKDAERAVGQGPIATAAGPVYV